MTGHIVGRRSDILVHIKNGEKIVEMRLGKPRFKRFKVGDTIRIREDFWNNGQIIKSKMSGVKTQITKVERFKTFRELLENIGFKKVMPDAQTLEEALIPAKQFYKSTDEAKLGAIAIHFKLLKI